MDMYPVAGTFECPHIYCTSIYASTVQNNVHTCTCMFVLPYLQRCMCQVAPQECSRGPLISPSPISPSPIPLPLPRGLLCRLLAPCTLTPLRLPPPHSLMVPPDLDWALNQKGLQSGLGWRLFQRTLPIDCTLNTP